MKQSLAITIFILVCTAAGCQKVQNRQRQFTPVKLTLIKSTQLTGETRYSANIRPNLQVDLNFKVGGYIASIQQIHTTDGSSRIIQEGDFVHEGAVLAQVRKSDYAVKLDQARSQLKLAQFSLESALSQSREAEVSLRQSELDFERARNLFQVQSLTKADYDAAEARRDGAQARVAAARNQVEAARAQVEVAESIVREADLTLLDTSLRAPFDGTVMSRVIEVGSLVGPGTVGFAMADTSSVKAIFGVPDTAVVSMRPGMQIQVNLEAIPNVRFSGRITRISPMSDPKSRAFDIEATIPNRQGRLRTGMIATVTIPNPGSSKEAVLLPLKAVIRSPKGPDQYAVLVLEREGENVVARLRDVQLGAAFGNAIEVTHGLQPGQQVITEGSNVATDGEPVQIIP